MRHPTTRKALLVKQVKGLCAQFGWWGDEALSDVVGA
ncbi:MAG: hypothetical protein H6R08_1424, partial [Proteobacteria bacterium]|nr:hypothetical protein [Pseudomonadota bacterium]